jgi:imidazolonepropionase-like amidohydrolase
MFALLLAGCASLPRNAPADTAYLGDAHTHLSYRGAAALDALHAAGINLVRDCGGDAAQLRAWREEIAAGRRRGPLIYFSGPVIDGPKPLARFRITVATPEQARRAVDRLADDGVDFIKTHNAVPREAYFAVLAQAKTRGLRVASHLPRGVSVHEAVEAGVGSIEHAAESLLASPIYAGKARDATEAMAWWDSPAGEAEIRFLAARKVTVTPTLVAYEAFTEARRGTADYAARREVVAYLIRLTGRLHAAGVTLLAGSDFAGPDAPIEPGVSLHRELALLREAGLSESEVRAAAGANLIAWLNADPHRVLVPPAPREPRAGATTGDLRE